MSERAAEPSTVEELSARLAEALKRVETAEASLADARTSLVSIERALAGARTSATAAAEAAAAAQAAAQAAPAAPAVPEAQAAGAPAQALAAADAAGADAPAAEAPAANADPRAPELIALLEAQQRKLQKRGFHRDDLYFHKCTHCGEQAVAKYSLTGKPGGRDIDLCLACGASASWRRRPDREDREKDETFDLATFLR